MSKLNLGMAYDMNKRNKKKMMAKGGQVESASNEQRPMPSEVTNDTKNVQQNSPKGQSIPKPRLQPLKGPSMVKSSAFTARLRADTDIMENDPPKRYEGMSTDKGPSEEEYMANHFAEGGEVKSKEDPGSTEWENSRGDKGYGAIIFKADGGMIDENDQPMEEADEEQHDSMVSAIMARRNKMAEGGRVDIESNNQEQPNSFDELNEAALKENYDSDFSDLDAPLDSVGDDIDSDDHDMVSKIRNKMIKRRVMGMK